MSTTGINLTNGDIVSTTNDSIAMSTIISQDTGEKDFESIREIRTQRLLANQVFSATADTAVLNCPIANGDRIFIKDAKNVIRNTVASGVVELPAGKASIIPAMTANVSNGGTATSSNNRSDCYKAFDKNDNNSTYMGKVGDDGKIRQVNYEFDTPPTVAPTFYKFNFNTTCDSNQRVYGSQLLGSYNGIDWQVLSYDVFNNNRHFEKTFPIQTPGIFKHYALKMFTNYPYSDSNYRLYDFDLLTSNGSYSIDTTTITSGAVPTHVWKDTDELYFNNNLATEKDLYNSYGTHGDFLYLNVKYNDVLIPGRELQTMVKMKAIGNNFIDITGQIYKEV